MANYLDCSKVAEIPASNKYRVLGPVCDSNNYPLSSSGKAIQIEGRRTGSHFNGVAQHEYFWLPVSIIRRVDRGIYGYELVIPVWFIAKNDLWRHFN